MGDDEKKKDKFLPPGPAPKPKENLNFLSTGKDKVIESDGLSLQEIAEDPELLEAYTIAQNKLYLQKLRQKEQDEAERLEREKENTPPLPFNSMQEVVNDLKNRMASEND
jgi:hypothetical protein